MEPGKVWQLVISISVPSNMNSFSVSVVIILVFLGFSDNPAFSLSSWNIAQSNMHVDSLHDNSHFSPFHTFCLEFHILLVAFRSSRRCLLTVWCRLCFVHLICVRYPTVCPESVNVQISFGKAFVTAAATSLGNVGFYTIHVWNLWYKLYCAGGHALCTCSLILQLNG
jgi:hypothetical protein